MATTPFTNTLLIDAVKLKSALPENQDQFSDQVILDLAHEVVRDTITPTLMRLRSEYFVTPTSVTTTSGTAAYRVNSRFIGGLLRDIQLVDGSNLVSLPQIDMEEAVSTNNGRPSAFYMRNNSFVLYPTPDAAYTLTVSGSLRPSSLTEVSNCAKISAIDTGTFQVTVDAFPSTWTAGTVVDFVKGTSGYEVLSIDNSISNASGVTITFASLPTGLEVGDYVAPQGTTPIPNIPEDLFSVLTEFTVAKILKSIGQNDEAAIANEAASQLLQNLLTMMAPRVSGAPKRFKTRLI